MAQALTPLANLTLASTQASITFSSISQSYRDLILITNISSLSGSPTQQGSNVRFNGDSGSNYHTIYALGNGSSNGAGNESGTSLSWGQFPSTGGFDKWEILDYSATDKHKIAIGRSNGVNASVWMYVNRWASTAAITSITLNSPDYGSDVFGIGSTFALYGVVA